MYFSVDHMALSKIFRLSYTALLLLLTHDTGSEEESDVENVKEDEDYDSGAEKAANN